MRKRDEFEDDGRMIADMSGIVPQRTFLPRRKPREDAPSGEGFDLTPKEKRWAALGAMKAVLMIAGAYLLGLGVLLGTSRPAESSRSVCANGSAASSGSSSESVMSAP